MPLRLRQTPLRFVAQTHPILKSWGLHRYALAAWLLFQRALAEERERDVFRRVREYYQRCWMRPGRFEG